MISGRIRIPVVCLVLIGTLLWCAAKTAYAEETVPEIVVQAEADRIAAIDRATRAAVCVFAKGGQGGGSGVVISPEGYALTNFHVAQPCGTHMQCGMADGVLYDAVIVSMDPVGDVAMIKLLGRDDFPSAELGDSDLLRQGDWCFAVGNPFLLATDFQPTVTFGIVSGTHRYQYPAGTLLEYTDCIQTDASINPGNSGGPLFNAEGQLIGINGRGSFEKRGRVNVGVGYAISINQIKNFRGFLQSGRILDHATLGATVSTDDEGKVRVSNILRSSDAFRRGIRSGDEIVAFGGRPVTTVNGYKNVLGIYPRGWRVPISYIDFEGVRHNTLVRLAGVHSRSELIEKIQGEEGPASDPPSEEAETEAEDEAETPEAPLYEERRGFVNYYFNRMQQERVWDAFSAGSSFDQRTGDWNLQGTMLGKDIEVLLSDNGVTAVIAESKLEIDLNEELHNQTAPENSGGLLLALMTWRRLLTVGPDRFGELYYLGATPLTGHEGLADVFVGTFDVLECWFYFDPEKGTLLAMELYPDSGVDPCEIYFEEYSDEQGQALPHRMHIVHGEKEDLTIEWTQFNIEAAQE